MTKNYSLSEANKGKFEKRKIIEFIFVLSLFW